MTQFSSISGACYISVEGCSLQSRGSNVIAKITKKIVEKYEKYDEKAIEDDEDSEEGTKRQFQN